MSGIFCVYRRDSAPLPVSSFAGMGQAMVHRGPDGIRTWNDTFIGLGQCCLDTTPPSGADQLPLVDRAAGVVVTADARLDNRDELISRLDVAGDGQDTVSDSRLLVLAYRRWGAQCVDYLLGDFAFVIWDQKQRQVFCARDHLGIKPFYYHLSGRIFAVASEVRSILKVQGIPVSINEARIADFLVSQLEGYDKTSTFYTSIRRLPPAHSLLVQQDRVVLTEYWRLDPQRETLYQSDAEYAEAFQEILSRSVRARLRCLRRPALLLSGGIDSAAVAAYANDAGKDGNHNSPVCHSALSDQTATCRESHFINSICGHLHVTSTFVTPQALRIYDKKINDVFTSIEEPFDEMTIIILLYLSARDNQHDVVLDGVEGDIVYSLSAVYPGLLMKQGRIFRGMAEICGYWFNGYNRQYPLYKTMNDALRPVLVPDWLRKLRHGLFRRTLRHDTFAESGINPDFAERVEVSGRLKKLQEYSRAAKCRSLRELHIQNITHPNLTVGLERYDRLAALCRVEPRHPLLDKRLVEFSCSLPWDQKVRNGWPKYLLRLACRPFLPAEVIWRKGWEHLGLSYTTTWINNNREHITGRIGDTMPCIKKYMSTKSINKILGLRGYYTEDEIMTAWSAYLLASWLQNRTCVY